MTKRSVLEEDIFTHFYPFCMINCTLMTLWTLRRTSWGYMAFGAFFMVEYIYFLFNFPVEAWHFHRRALSTNKAYAQHLRDSYLVRFPETPKAAVYAEVNAREARKYKRLLAKLEMTDGEHQTVTGLIK